MDLSTIVEARRAGLTVELVGGLPRVRGPRRLEAVVRDLLADPDGLRAELERERALCDALRSRLAVADAKEAAARARGEEPPDHEDPRYWTWADAQPTPTEGNGWTVLEL